MSPTCEINGVIKQIKLDVSSPTGSFKYRTILIESDCENEPKHTDFFEIQVRFNNYELISALKIGDSVIAVAFVSGRLWKNPKTNVMANYITLTLTSIHKYTPELKDADDIGFESMDDFNSDSIF